MPEAESHIENEVKFNSFDSEKFSDMKCSIMSFFNDGKAWRERNHTDEYFDTEGMDLPKGCSLRRRDHNDGTFKYTAKIPAAISEGTVCRREIQAIGTEGTFEELTEFAGDIFPGIVLSEKPVVTIQV